MFYFYERFKTLMANNTKYNDSDLPVRAVSGALAGIISSTITYSLDPVKTIMSADYENKAGSIRNILRNIYRKDGFRGFYHGYAATMCSVTPFIGKNYRIHQFLNQSLVTNTIILRPMIVSVSNFSLALNMTFFDYLKSNFARPADSPYFSIVNML